MISVEHLSKQFSQQKVLDDISLQAYSGQVIALLGPSGAGKSTLLRCLNLLESPEQGEIIFAGEAIRWHKKPRVPSCQQQVLNLRRQVSMVFQQFHLWSHKTVLQNIIEAPIHVLKHDKQQMLIKGKTLLAKVGLTNKADTYPRQLSGGQQQRVAIARALAMEPQVILFDEPTASLDPQRVGEVLNVIKVLAMEGKTMIVATHEMEFAKQVADHIIFMDAGQIVAEGSAQQLFSEGKSTRFSQFISTI
ncbi:MAG: amino acid ABC transporter ATP-binding protein [Gammaproteobacteria bacterium]|nr:amino acid ABC transporter ATP-binding protein [Gammaproteobacteria bacterium]